MIGTKLSRIVLKNKKPIPYPQARCPSASSSRWQTWRYLRCGWLPWYQFSVENIFHNINCHAQGHGQVMSGNVKKILGGGQNSKVILLIYDWFKSHYLIYKIVCVCLTLKWWRYATIYLLISLQLQISHSMHALQQTSKHWLISNILLQLCKRTPTYDT